MLNVTCSRKAIWTLKCDCKLEINERAVYILVAENPLKYPSGQSRVIYIGTTKRRRGNPATLVMHRVNEALEKLPGIGKVAMYIATCERRKGMKTWERLENSLLAVFLQRYGKLPKLNKRYDKRKSSGRQPENMALFRQEKLQKTLFRFAP